MTTASLPRSGAAAKPAPQAPSRPLPDDVRLAPILALKRRVVAKCGIIAILSIALAVLLPFAKPLYLYYARTPENQVRLMTALDMPNMTNRAIVSWATTSITEVLTMGFGDIDSRLPKQRIRFTSKGWDAYVETFRQMKISQTFKQHQLVMTAVPSNTPVILGQGINLKKVYQWVVQMPVVMTYATNDNITRKQRGTVTLIIVRVPFEENSFGVAIHSWRFD